MSNDPNPVLSILNRDVNLKSHSGLAIGIALLEKVALKLALRFNPDPLIRVTINGQGAVLNYQHHLPRTLKIHPLYESELPRLAIFLMKDSLVKIIDIGANVGDSVLMMPATLRAKYMCVEPEPRFFKLLQRNLKGRSDIVIENCIASDQEGGSQTISFEVTHGTASVVVTESRDPDLPIPLPTMTVDGLVQKHREFQDADILKVDTDGYDFKVLVGSSSLLRNAHPAIYVEISTWHWLHVGHVAPAQAFDFLAAEGYSDAILYDSNGYLIVSFEISDFRNFAFLFDYALRRGAVCYNAILFHRTCRARFEEFLQSELQHFQTMAKP